MFLDIGQSINLIINTYTKQSFIFNMQQNKTIHYIYDATDKYTKQLPASYIFNGIIWLSITQLYPHLFYKTLCLY